MPDKSNYPKYLYKYMPFDTALVCLASNKFRWSHVSICNDTRDSDILSAHGRDDLLQNALKHSAVFCLSERKDLLPMWAHYADNHKGVIFKINVKNFEKQYTAGTTQLLQVEYNQFEDFPKSIVPHPDIASRFIKYKHVDWSYEKEWRFVAKNLLSTSSIGCDSLKLNYFDHKFSAESIEEITLGYKAGPQRENLLISVLNNLRLYNADVCILSPGKSLTLPSKKWKYDESQFRYVGPEHIAS